MAEDVIEFGPAPAASESTERERRQRNPMESAIPVAGAGAIAAAASLIGPWQTTAYPDFGNEGETNEVGSALAGLGGQGTAYMIALTLLATAVVVALFGQPAIRHTARLIGLGLAGSTLALLVGVGYSVTRTSTMADFRLFPADQLDDVTFTPEWGLHVAFAGVLAFTIALAMTGVSVSADAATPSSEIDEDDLPETELVVSMHPATAQAPGTDHYQHYMRP